MDGGTFGQNAKSCKKNLAFVQNYFQRLEQSLAMRHRSKGALAAHLGVALSTVSRWKDAVPRAETVHATAEWLGVNAKWLLTGEAQKKPESGVESPGLDAAEMSVSKRKPKYPAAGSEKEIWVQPGFARLEDMPLPPMEWPPKPEAADMAAEGRGTMEQRMAALEAQVRLLGAALDALLRERSRFPAIDKPDNSRE